MAIRYYDGDVGKGYIVNEWIDDGKYIFVINQDELDLLRWDSESPNTGEKNIYENLRGLFKRRYQRKKPKLQLVKDDGIKQTFKITIDKHGHLIYDEKYNNVR